MQVSARIADPGKTPVTLTITMPASEWEVVRKHLTAQEWPVPSLAHQIQDAIWKVGKVVYGERPDGESA